MFLILLPSWYNVYWIILYLHICDIYFKQMYLQNTYTHFTFFLPFCLHNVRTSFVSLNGERRQDTTSSFSLWVFAAAKWLRHYQQRRADFGVGFSLFGAIPHWCLDENNVSLKPARFLHILYKAGFLYSTFLYWDLYMYYRYAPDITIIRYIIDIFEYMFPNVSAVTYPKANLRATLFRIGTLLLTASYSNGISWSSRYWSGSYVSRLRAVTRNSPSVGEFLMFIIYNTYII